MISTLSVYVPSEAQTFVGGAGGVPPVVHTTLSTQPQSEPALTLPSFMYRHFSVCVPVPETGTVFSVQSTVPLIRPDCSTPST